MRMEELLNVGLVFALLKHGRIVYESNHFIGIFVSYRDSTCVSIFRSSPLILKDCENIIRRDVGPRCSCLSLRTHLTLYIQ